MQSDEQTAVTAPPLFSEELMSRKELIFAAKISRTTLWRYERMGFILLNGRSSVAALELWKFMNAHRLVDGRPVSTET